MDCGNVGNAHEGEQSPQMRLLRVERLVGTFAVKTAARKNGDGALASKQALQGGPYI